MKNLVMVGLIGLIICLVFTLSSTAECLQSKLGGAYLTYADKFGGEITKKELLSTTELGVAGCAIGSKIYAFTLVINKEGKSKKVSGESFLLTDAILNDLRSLRPGDTFIFSDIKAHLPSGDKIGAMGRTFTVK